MPLSPIGKEQVDSWYEIGYEPEGLVIRVHESALPDVLKHYAPTMPMVKLYRELWPHLPEFIPPTEETWGFGSALTNHGQNGEWLTWFMAWPTPKPNEEKSLPQLCAGLTLQTLLNTFLSGTGSPWEETSRGTAPQLIDVHSMSIGHNGEGSGFAATLSPIVRAWAMTQQDGSHHPGITQAIRDVHNLMLNRTSDTEEKIRFARVNAPGRIFLNLGSGAANLGSEMTESTQVEKGYDLGPHNLSLFYLFPGLAGLAKLHDVVREWELSGS